MLLVCVPNCGFTRIFPFESEDASGVRIRGVCFLSKDVELWLLLPNRRHWPVCEQRVGDTGCSFRTSYLLEWKEGGRRDSHRESSMETAAVITPG